MTRTLDVYIRNETFVSDKVTRLDEYHRAGLPAYAVIEAVAVDYVSIEELVGTRAEVAHGYADETRHSFWGRIDTATVLAGQGGSDGAPSWTYRLKVIATIGLLDRSVDSQIFQNLTTEEIIKQIFEQHGIAPEEYDFTLDATYPKREYCVQYQESALAFISRLCEEEGIYFYSYVADGEEAEKLYFRDDSSSAKDIPDGLELPYRPGSHGATTEDTLSELHPAHRVRSGKFVSRDFNFMTPQLDVTTNDLTKTAEASAHTDFEVYDYPTCYLELADGSTVGEIKSTTLERLNQVRLEAEQVGVHTVAAVSNCPRLTIAHKVKVSDSEDVDGEYFIFACSYHFAIMMQKQDDGSSVEIDSYRCEIELLPIASKYRSPQVTAKPVIHGPQTARIVAPEGSESEEIHTDEHGRVQVKFHWDRAANAYADATCWMRVQQLQTSGSMIIPRVHWEVIVEYMEGNPDRPVVTGRLYNGMFMPPYALPEGKTRTAMRTNSHPSGGGSNEIRFEDKAGAEEIMIHSQYDTQMVTANNKKKNVGNNESLHVKNNSESGVSGNSDTKITKGSQNDIGADQSVSVGGNRKREINAVYGLTSGGDTTVTVGGNQFEMTGNPLEALLAIAAERAAEMAAAAAANAVGQVTAAVQGAVDQVLGPVDDLCAQVDGITGNMNALANGDLGTAAGLVAGASGLPGAGAMASAIAGPPAAMTPAAGQSAGDIAGVNALRAAATGMIQQGASGAMDAVNNALGTGGGDGGGQSGANAAGPEGSVDGVDEAKNTKGPGHQINKVGASHTETSAALRVMAAVNGINTNVGASATQTVGAAYLELILGDRAESVEGMKSETSIGLIVLSKGDETEHVGGAKNTTVGGAVLQSIKGDYSVEAGAPATLIGALHKMDAKGSITFKCGGSEVVLDGGGITITAPIFTCTLPKHHLPKKVSDS
ncbi:MAG: type VI secretion system tip protein TssI/VgrG [Polyangiaceae bacterium]